MEEYIVNNKKVIINPFNEIRSAEDAYLIGYLMADGNYCAATNKRKHRMSVSSTDQYIIENFKNNYQPLTELRVKTPNSNFNAGIFGRKEFKHLTFSSLLSNTFDKFGVMHLKSQREIKNIPQQHFESFLLGLFDADGSISYGNRKDRNRLWANFRITHPSENILNAVKEYLNSIEIYASLKPKGSENCLVLTVSKVESVKQLFSYLYSKEPEVFNFTKKEKYLRLLESV